MAAVSDAESVETNPQWVPEEHPDQVEASATAARVQHAAGCHPRMAECARRMSSPPPHANPTTPPQSEWPVDEAVHAEEDEGGEDGGDEGGGEATESGAAAESSDEDEEDADFLRVRENDMGDGVLLTIVSLPLPPAGVPGGRLRRQTFVFQRQLEEVLYGATSGTYTGAIHRAIEVRATPIPARSPPCTTP